MLPMKFMANRLGPFFSKSATLCPPTKKFAHFTLEQGCLHPLGVRGSIPGGARWLLFFV